MHGSVLVTFTLLAAAVNAMFVIVALSSRGAPQDYAVVKPRGYAVRRAWFWSLLVALVVAFVVAFPSVPYTKAATAVDAVAFPVVARQYVFENLPEVVPLGTPVVFNVTAADVNHGFAIYDPQERLVAQVQAMPGVANDLHVTFTDRGKYTVRCLEYCGISHAFMSGAFEVR